MTDFYLNLSEIIHYQLIENSVNPELAVSITKDIINDVAQTMGGQAVYLKNNSQAVIDEKHKQIVNEFIAGKSCIELCRKYQVSRTWVKQLIKRAEAEKAESACY